MTAFAQSVWTKRTFPGVEGLARLALGQLPNLEDNRGRAAAPLVWMAMASHLKWGSKSPRVYVGNEAIARGGLEAGLGLASTYPGTPSSEISANFFQIARESTLYFQYSTNEKVALEVAAAAANSGVRSMCIMKHVGVNVAADALMTLAYVGVKAGLVIISADDPYMFSSQNEQDNSYYGKL